MPYNPRVIDTSYGPAVANAFGQVASAVGGVMQQKRQDAMQEKQWARQDARDERQFQQQTALMDRREAAATAKELASKQEEADFSAAAWEAIKQRMPDVVSREMDDKFHSGSLGAKRGLLSQVMTVAAKREQENQQAANRFDPSTAQAYPIPGAPDMGLVYDAKGRGGMMVKLPQTGPAFDTGTAPAGNLWDGSMKAFDEPVPQPTYFNQMETPLPAYVPKPAKAGAAAPPAAATPANLPPTARPPESFYGGF